MVAGLLPLVATRAPSARNWRAVSRPMPLVPPAIRARLPLSLSMVPFLAGFAASRADMMGCDSRPD
jgi:hypothetical protein